MKKAFHEKYFERNCNNTKNKWKGIKFPISQKPVASSVSTVLYLDDGDTISNSYDIGNNFNDYFASIAETTKKSIKYHISIFQTNIFETSSTIFLQPTDKEEIANIISSLNSNKTSSPISIHYRILFLLKKIKFRSNWEIYSTSLS